MTAWLLKMGGRAVILSAFLPSVLHFCNWLAFNACKGWPKLDGVRVVRPPVAPVWCWRVCFYCLINLYQLHFSPPG
jgi:hypothetical protein